MAIERFLILDDDEANVLFFEVLLKELGYSEVSSYTDGETALKAAEQKRVQFILTAWEIEPMPGTVFIQRIHDNQRLKFCPCIIYSKEMTAEESQLTQELGLKNILVKPFDKETAGQLIKELIRKEDELSPSEKRMRKIEALVAENRTGEALPLFDDKLTKGDLRHRARTALGDIWIRMSHFDKAERDLKDALRIKEDYLPALYLLGKTYSLQKKHDQAIDILKQLVEKSPLNVQNLSHLGQAYVEANEMDAAKATFGKIKELDEESPAAKDGLAKIAFKEGDMDRARQLVQQTQNGAELARYFNNIAISFVQNSDYDHGIETYQQAIDLLYDKAKLHLLKYNLGLAHIKKGELLAAFTILAESFFMEPKFEKSYAALVKIVKQMKEQSIKYDLEVIRKIKALRKEIQTKSDAA